MCPNSTCGAAISSRRSTSRIPRSPPRRSAAPDRSRSTGPSPSALIAATAPTYAVPSAAARTGWRARPRPAIATHARADAPAPADTAPWSERCVSWCMNAYSGASAAS